MEQFLYVGIGGFFGANARFLLSSWTDSLLAPRWGMFPYGTLFVNALGSFGMALFAVWFSVRTGMSPQTRLLVGSGFFGAFTTFSAFANDSVTMLGNGSTGLSLLNVVLNNGLCLFAAAVGLFFGHRLFSAT